MSAALVGNLPQGKFLFTDAMVALKEKIKSHRDCNLKDKICKGLATHGYYSLVGDETILFGIYVLDSWSSQSGIHFDFTDPSCMRKALDVAEKIIEVYEKTGISKDDNLNRSISYVYTISGQKVVDYCILRKDNKYHITKYNQFLNNQVSFNYAGLVLSVDTEVFKNAEANECIKIAADYMTQYHTKMVATGKPSLKYDFDNRFCGALIPSEGADLLTLPFRSLDELIVNFAGGDWDLLESPPFEQ